MKKLLILFGLVIITLGFSACTDDTDDTAPPATQNVVAFTVGGTAKSFTNVVVTQAVFITGEESIPTYNVLATPAADNGEYVAFQVRQDYTGTEGLYTFIYNDAQGNHTLVDNFVMDITTNTTEKLTGTFSGSLFQNEVAGPSVTISSGSFNINYDF